MDAQNVAAKRPFRVCHASAAPQSAEGVGECGQIEGVVKLEVPSGQSLAVPAANPAAIITPSQAIPSLSTQPPGAATLPPSGGIADPSAANSAPTPPTDALPLPTHHSAQALTSDHLGLAAPTSSASAPHLSASAQPSTERRRKFAVQTSTERLA